MRILFLCLSWYVIWDLGIYLFCCFGGGGSLWGVLVRRSLAVRLGILLLEMMLWGVANPDGSVLVIRVVMVIFSLVITL